MADATAIEWADSTFNPWMGCTKISPACDHCYAERDTARFGRVQWGAGARRVRTSAANWRKPLRWNATPYYECEVCGLRTDKPLNAQCLMRPHALRSSHVWKPARRRVFCASLADVFDNEVGPTWRGELFRLIAQTPNLDWLLLTKRIGNAERMIADAIWWPAEGHRYRPPPNVWLGATICNQAEADRDIPKLLATPAAVRFLSIEPMLGPVDLAYVRARIRASRSGITNAVCYPSGEPWVDWIIAGGESGPHARPMHPDWVRSLRDQCAAAGVPFFMKQMGGATKRSMPEIPNDLMVRSFPNANP